MVFLSRTLSFIALGIIGAAVCAPALAADLPIKADTYIQTDSPTSNFGLSGITAVASNRTTLLQFDPALITQSSGANATLKIKVLLAKNSMDGVAAHIVTSPWSEKTVTAKTMPSISSNVLDSKTITSASQGQVVTFDVSSALANWRANPSANFGIALVPTTPTPNLQLGSREGGSGAVLSLGGTVAKNSVTVAVSGGDYATPQAAVDNALAGDNWCVSPAPPTNRCTINVKEGVYPATAPLALPAEFALIGAGRGVTTIMGGIAARSGVISDLSFENGLTYNAAATSGTTLELDRVAIQIGDPYAQHGINIQGNSLVMTDSIITASSTNKDIPVHVFECGHSNCQSIRLMRTQVSATGAFSNGDSFNDNAIFFYIGGGPIWGGDIDLEDSSFTLIGKGGVFFKAMGDGFAMNLTIDNSFLSGGIAIATFNGNGPLIISNSTVVGQVSWWDQSDPVTVTGSTIVGGLGEGFDENLGQQPHVPVTISNSTIDNVGLTLAILSLKDTIVTGNVDLDSSNGNFTSAQIGSISLEPPGPGVASTASCTRVFDAKQKLLPSSCIATN